MSEFTVLPAAVSEQVAPLAAMSGSIESMRTLLLSGIDAAAGTPAADALEDMSRQLHAQLAGYGAATDSMFRAANGAADNYIRADQASAPGGVQVTTVKTATPAPVIHHESRKAVAPAPAVQREWRKVAAPAPAVHRESRRVAAPATVVAKASHTAAPARSMSYRQVRQAGWAVEPA